MGDKVTIKVKFSPSGNKTKKKMEKSKTLKDLRNKLKIKEEDLFLDKEECKIDVEDEEDFTLDELYQNQTEIEITIQEFYFLIYIDNIPLKGEKGEDKIFYLGKKEKLSNIVLPKPYCDNDYAFLDKNKNIILNKDLGEMTIEDIIKEGPEKANIILMKKTILNEKK